MKIVNATPHAININGNCLEPCGKIARVEQNNIKINTIDGIDIFKSVFGNVVDLPDKEEDTIYIVSALVRSACTDRKDIFSPSDFIRDSAGNITGCKGLISN